MNTYLNTETLFGTARQGLDKRALFFACYCAAFIVSKYLGLATGYALDDYSIVSNGNSDGLVDFFLSQGRYTNAGLDAVLRASNLNMANFSVIAFFATIAFSGMFYISVFAPCIKQTHIQIAAVSALLGAHSYYTEYVTFRQAALPMSIMFAMLWLAVTQYRKAVFLKNRPLMRLPLAIAAGLIAMGANQLAVCFAAIAALYLHISYALYNLEPTPSGHVRIEFRQLTQSILISALVGASLTTGSIGIAAVARTIKAISVDTRASFVELSQLPERLNQLLDLMLQLLIKSEPIASTPTKILVLLGLATLLWPTSKFQLRHMMYALTFMLFAWVSALVPVIFSATWWPVPRTLIAIPFALAGTIALCDTKSGWRTSLAAYMVIIASMFFCAHSNAALMNQQRLNRWDMAQAQEIAYRVAERFPTKRDKIAIVGGAWSYPLTPGMAQGDMNLSAMSVGWAIDPLFDEATGTNLNVRAAPEYGNECSGKEKFPSNQSMFEKNSEVIVCL